MKCIKSAFNFVVSIYLFDCHVILWYIARQVARICCTGMKQAEPHDHVEEQEHDV